MIRLISAALPRFALFLLALIPVLIGAAILISLQRGDLNTFSDPADLVRRASYPWAVIGHILGGSAMLMLGFSQFSARLRRAEPRLHRWVGRVLVLAGSYFALSGLWMNASATAQDDSVLYDAGQNLFAVLFLVILALGVRAIRQGRVAVHRAWMMRAYAITLGAATQTVMLLPVFLIFGPPTGLVADFAFLSGWVINLAVAELLIRRVRFASLWPGNATPAPTRP